ncbi:MAG: dehypoxanthine futalosine cyclase [Kiritimatiellales bacterium]|nr:dehypoxanthine futalosine cyclase [Kiritimatiellales bacterium]
MIEQYSKRIGEVDAMALLENATTAELMAMADARRRELHGRRTFYVHSHNLNPTNICENRCKLCAFWRERDADDAYVVTLEKARKEFEKAREWNLTDLHIVGGLIPELNLEYYEELMKLAKEILPDALVQGMTAVEIRWLADQSDAPVVEVLQRLKAAGFGAISGGGAEIFAEETRRKICPEKISGDEWLAVHEAAHGLDLPTNATMLFGHIESDADIVDHLSRLRNLQDRTGGFQAFIPLPFHADGTQLGVERGPSGDRIARVVALSRIFLDNFPHVRVLVNYVDRKLLGALAHGGVDDIGGTSLNERIAKAAGAPDSHRFLSEEEMDAFVRNLGLEPVLTNSAYQGVGSGERGAGSKTTVPSGRLSFEEAVRLHDEVPLAELGKAAHAKRLEMVLGDQVTFVVDRNLNVTNICEAGCKFCAFYVFPDTGKGFTLTVDETVEKVKQSAQTGATQVLIQGGLNPACGLAYYEEIFRRVSAETDIWIHSLSPTEIVYLAKKENLSIKEVLVRIKDAGLKSLPGGGAEILVDEVRQRVSPNKTTAGEWFAVMEAAHALGMKSTATMVYGLGETTAQRVEHLMRVRDLQDKTGGFTAFIPWSFQAKNTELPDLPEQTGADYLRIVALARLVLDNVPHIQAGWVTEGPDTAQLALSFGADDFGGVLMEEKVVSSAGITYFVTRGQVVNLVREAGFVPVQRTTQYDTITIHAAVAEGS